MADVAISGERIAALLEPGTSVAAARTIDASGKHLIPGAIDAHSHHREPGSTRTIRRNGRVTGEPGWGRQASPSAHWKGDA